jgi:hypothetical protein
MPPLPEIFRGFFSSAAAEGMLASVLGVLPQEKLTGLNDADAEKNFNTAGLEVHKNLLPQDKVPFLAATNSLCEKLQLLSNPGNFKVDDIVSAAANQLNAALTLARKAPSGYQEFQDSTREFLTSQIVKAENQQRNALRPKQDTQGKSTAQEGYFDTLNEFNARYYGQMLRKLVGPPPDALRIGKNDAPDEYYLWGVYGLKRDPMEFGLELDGNIAAYCKADNAIKDLFTRYGAGTSKADEKILDDPAGDYKRSPNEFRASALSGMIKALTTFYDETKSRAADPSKSNEAKNAIIRSIALVESLRGAFGLANGPTGHTIAGLARFPSDADRKNFEAKFPGIMQTWDTLGDAIRRGIVTDPNADRSDIVPVFRRQGFLRDAPTGRPDEPKK